MSFSDQLGLHRSYCELDLAAARANVHALKALLAPSAKLAAVVKANAYGHGLAQVWSSFVQAGADWLCVDSLQEASELRGYGYTGPLFVLGYLPPWQADVALELDVHCLLLNLEQVEAFGSVSNQRQRRQAFFLKIESGTHRQGHHFDDNLKLAKACARYPYLYLEGCSSHFANIEDSTDHSFARKQIEAFERDVAALRTEGFALPIRSIANSAASILWPQVHNELVRPGIAIYGMWPSTEALVSARALDRTPELKAVLSWKTFLAQVKNVPENAPIGYGCSVYTTRPSRIAILPVGYYDGYPRSLARLAHVLVRGKRAPILGRICMNMCMIDVTDIPEAREHDEVVLLGEQGNERISTEMLAAWAKTINYEFCTQIRASLPRLIKNVKT